MTSELIDQVAHVLAGLVLPLLLHYFVGMPGWWAWLTMMVCAEVRELAQHDWKFSRQGFGSFLDLSCFAVGGAAAMVVIGA